MGPNLPVFFSISVRDCYTTGVKYLGKANKTVSGRTCQEWAVKTPHNHTINDTTAIANYCRDWGHHKPWCYTTDQHKRWEDCQVPICREYMYGLWCALMSWVFDCGVPQFREYTFWLWRAQCRECMYWLWRDPISWVNVLTVTCPDVVSFDFCVPQRRVLMTWVSILTVTVSLLRVCVLTVTFPVVRTCIDCDVFRYHDYQLSLWRDKRSLGHALTAPWPDVVNIHVDYAVTRCRVWGHILTVPCPNIGLHSLTMTCRDVVDTRLLAVTWY